MNLLIIDDEPLVRQGIQQQVEQLFPSRFEIHTAHGVASGISQIESVRPSIVLLDVQMLDGTGFELLERVEDRNFALIFLTAFAEFAVQAFEEEATNYLLKPLSPVKLKRAINSALKAIEQQTAFDLYAAQNVHRRLSTERFTYPTSEGLSFLPYRDILYAKADGNYFRLFLHSATELVSKPLRFFETKMNPQAFMRIHRSYIINLNEVSSYLKTSGGFVRMSNGDELPLSSTYKGLFLERIT